MFSIFHYIWETFVAVNLQELYGRLNFWINKKTGAWYTLPELDDVVDSGSMSLFSDLKPKYATSQDIKDALAPFRASWNFSPSDTISGVIPVPSNLNYLSLISITTEYPISGRTLYQGVVLINEDELATRLMSQTDPVTYTSPVGEQLAPGFFRLYPTNGYTGVIRFFRRPTKPYFAYTTISQRVIVYDPVNSVQLEWPENWQNAVLIKGLESIGINLTDQEVQQFAETKAMQNFNGINRT